jgi:polyhydroxybutyrate depolymerase
MRTSSWLGVGRPPGAGMMAAAALALASCSAGAGDGGEPPACTPTTCAAQGKDCGSISDGCGATLPCGTCSAGTCGGGGVANVCGTPGTTGGCGHAPAQTGYLSRSMTVAGRERAYQLYVPAGVTNATPLPLVVVFHHSGGTIADAKSYGIQGYSGAKALYLFPQALETGYGVGWELGCSNYDMQFFDAMLAATEAEACVDTGRIFTTGFSWGADMTVATGCCRGDVVRAIAPTSGTGWGLGACTSTRPAYRATIGTADEYYPVADVHAVTQTYRTAHHCSSGTTGSPPSPPCVAYTGCDAPVIECVFDGLGHWFPEGGQQAVWTFFAGF